MAQQLLLINGIESFVGNQNVCVIKRQKSNQTLLLEFFTLGKHGAFLYA